MTAMTFILSIVAIPAAAFAIHYIVYITLKSVDSGLALAVGFIASVAVVIPSAIAILGLSILIVLGVILYGIIVAIFFY